MYINSIECSWIFVLAFRKRAERRVANTTQKYHPAIAPRRHRAPSARPSDLVPHRPLTRKGFGN
jgi:hypothetical protein